MLQSRKSMSFSLLILFCLPFVFLAWLAYWVSLKVGTFLYKHLGRRAVSISAGATLICLLFLIFIPIAAGLSMGMSQDPLNDLGTLFVAAPLAFGLYFCLWIISLGHLIFKLKVL